MPSQVTRHLKARVGANIRAARKSRGLTQAQLARRLEMESLNISRWERGMVVPRAENLVRLADELGYDLGWFYVDRQGEADAA